MAGETFSVEHIIADAPLYLNYPSGNGEDLGTYVCGSKTDVRLVIENF